jgi:hypothetical protein
LNSPDNPVIALPGATVTIPHHDGPDRGE